MIMNICNIFMGCLWPFTVRGHFRVIWSTCLKMAWISKAGSGSAKWRHSITCGVKVNHIVRTFDLVVLKLIFWTFGVIVSKWPAHRFWCRIMWENDTFKPWHGSKWRSLNLKYIEKGWSWSETGEINKFAPSKTARYFTPICTHIVL